MPSVLMLAKDKKYYLFSWKEEIAIPVFDAQMQVNVSGLEIKDGMLQGSVKSGQTYIF